MPYVPHTDDELEKMLEAVGASSLDELYRDIPEDIRLGRPLDLPAALSEADLVAHLNRLASKNAGANSMSCFLGGGTYNHYVPPAVDQLISRPEFYTAYTPYQPEVSQGTLQAIFEYQTMVCELLGMEVANASMYDGAEAAAEAVLMAERIRPKNREGAVVMSGSLNPLYKRTIRTYLEHRGREVLEAGYGPDGALDPDGLSRLAKSALAVVVQHPNYFGCLEDMEAAANVCEKEGAVFIVVVTEALSLGLLEPPGAFNADIAVAEGQSVGLPMGYGGPHLGMFASREEHVRKMPGRLAGETLDKDGRRGYVLTIATREQHIRRAKATSNICTNQGLMALASAVYMSLLGPSGITELAARNRDKCEKLKAGLAQISEVKQVFSGPTFNEFVLDLGADPAPVLSRMKEKGVLAGIPLAGDYPGLENAVLVAVTEMITDDEMDAYVAGLKAALKD